MAYLASDLVNGALRLIGAVASGETPSTDEAADGFTALTQLYDAWSADELADFATRTAAIALVASTSSYAIPGARPIKILSADMSIAGMQFPVNVVGPDKWASLPDRLNSGPRVQYAYCDYAYPTPAVLVAPVPTATATLNLYCSVDLPVPATAATAIALPELYTDALRFALAVKLAPEYGRTLDPAVIARAGESLDAIRKLNASNRAGKSVLEIPPTDGTAAQAQ